MKVVVVVKLTEAPQPPFFVTEGVVPVGPAGFCGVIVENEQT